MQLDLEQASLELGTPMEHVHGGVHLRGQSDGRNWRCDGDMLIDSAICRGVQLTGTVALVDDVDRICEVFAGLMVKYEGLDPAHVDSVKAAYRERAPKQRALRLDVTRVVSWDHGKQAGA